MKKKGKEPIGDRMKTFYEDAYQLHLPRRSYLIIRVDGRAFHTYTKPFDKPFDWRISEAMRATASELLHEIQGAKIAYVQSDEISILVTDFDKLTTSAWFDNNLQKIVSMSASIASSAFMRAMVEVQELIDDYQCTGYTGVRFEKLPPPLFDSRVMILPSKSEVSNYFYWRYRDATRNAILTFGQSKYSQKQLNGKGTGDVYELIKDEYEVDVEGNRYVSVGEDGDYVTLHNEVTPYNRYGEFFFSDSDTEDNADGSIRHESAEAFHKYLEFYIPNNP